MSLNHNKCGPDVWLTALEDANVASDGAGYDLWDKIHKLVRLRGVSTNIGDWPGYVYIPSDFLNGMLSSQIIKVPSEWNSMDIGVLSRIVAILSAWNMDKKILYLTDLAAEIVRNSWVDVALKVNTFSLIPGMAVYIDMTKVQKKSRDFPNGFFVTLNVRESGMSELVFAMDFGTSLDIKAIPLDGKIPDEIFNSFLKEWLLSTKKDSECTNANEIPRAVMECSGELHSLLSATLLACISEPRRITRHLQDEEAGHHNQAIVDEWEIGSDLHLKNLDVGLMATSLSPACMPIVGHWSTSENGYVVKLRCAAGAFPMVNYSNL